MCASVASESKILFVKPNRFLEILLPLCGKKKCNSFESTRLMKTRNQQENLLKVQWLRQRKKGGRALQKLLIFMQKFYVHCGCYIKYIYSMLLPFVSVFVNNAIRGNMLHGQRVSYYDQTKKRQSIT